MTCYLQYIKFWGMRSSKKYYIQNLLYTLCTCIKIASSNTYTHTHTHNAHVYTVLLAATCSFMGIIIIIYYIIPSPHAEVNRLRPGNTYPVIRYAVLHTMYIPCSIYLPLQ